MPRSSPGCPSAADSPPWSCRAARRSSSTAARQTAVVAALRRAPRRPRRRGRAQPARPLRGGRGRIDLGGRGRARDLLLGPLRTTSVTGRSSSCRPGCSWRCRGRCSRPRAARRVGGSVGDRLGPGPERICCTGDGRERTAGRRPGLAHSDGRGRLPRSAVRRTHCADRRRGGVAGVLAPLPAVDLAHLATHGHHVADNALFSGLELADGRLMGYDVQSLAACPAARRPLRVRRRPPRRSPRRRVTRDRHRLPRLGRVHRRRERHEGVGCRCPRASWRRSTRPWAAVPLPRRPSQGRRAAPASSASAPADDDPRCARDVDQGRPDGRPEGGPPKKTGSVGRTASGWDTSREAASGRGPRHRVSAGRVDGSWPERGPSLTEEPRRPSPPTAPRSAPTPRARAGRVRSSAARPRR